MHVKSGISIMLFFSFTHKYNIIVTLIDSNIWMGHCISLSLQDRRAKEGNVGCLRAFGHIADQNGTFRYQKSLLLPKTWHLLFPLRSRNPNRRHPSSNSVHSIENTYRSSRETYWQSPCNHRRTAYTAQFLAAGRAWQYCRRRAQLPLREVGPRRPRRKWWRIAF